MDVCGAVGRIVVLQSKSCELGSSLKDLKTGIMMNHFKMFPPVMSHFDLKNKFVENKEKVAVCTPLK